MNWVSYVCDSCGGNTSSLLRRVPAAGTMECKGRPNKNMSRTKTASKYLLAIFMIGAGTMHFVRTDFYVKIMPPYVPLHREL